MPTTRWMRKDIRPVSPCCGYCGRWSAGDKPCEVVTCLACGTPQCHGNGLRRGTCSICLIGVLPGWSGCTKPCCYKGCSELGIADGPRGRVCKVHALQARKGKNFFTKQFETVAQFVFRQTEERSKSWTMVST